MFIMATRHIGAVKYTARIWYLGRVSHAIVILFVVTAPKNKLFSGVRLDKKIATKLPILY